MLKKIITNIFLIFFVFWFSFSFLSPTTIFLNPFLAIMVYLLMFSEIEIQALWVVVGGILFDFFSPLPFGSFLVIFCLLYFGGSYLLERFFTKRAFSTMLILSLIINGAFLLFLLLESSLLNFFNATPSFIWSWHGAVIQILSNLFFGMIMFAVTKFFTSRLRLNAI